MKKPGLSNDRPVNGDDLEKWVSDFLWYWQGSGMSNGEAAEIIFTTIKRYLLDDEQGLLSSLQDPQALHQSWEISKA